MNVYENWVLSSPLVKDEWVIGTQLRPAVQAKLHNIIHKYHHGELTVENLNFSVGILQDQLAEEVRQAIKAENQAAEAMQMLERHPQFSQDDFNVDRVSEFFRANPSASVADFEKDIIQRPDKYHWLAAPAKAQLPNLRNMTPAQLDEARAIYGKQAVDAELAQMQRSFQKGASERKALDSSRGPSAEEQAAQAAAELKAKHSDPEQIARVKSEAEFIASSYQTGSHSDNARGRQLLRELVVYKVGTQEVDWFLTRDARASWIKSSEEWAKA